VQTRQFEVHRSFESFEVFWQTAYGSPRLRELFASLSPQALQRLTVRVRQQLDVTDAAPLVIKARANAVKGRRL
jgi:hypothetical protein